MSHDPFAQMNDELNAAQAKGRKAPKSDKSLKESYSGVCDSLDELNAMRALKEEQK